MNPVQVTVEGGPESGRQVQLQPGASLVLGRGRDVGLLILDEQASRQHAALTLTPTGVTVTDLGSANGTFLDGERLPPHQAVPVGPGGEVRIGAHRITLGGRLRDDYERLGELGRGGFGTVYAARRRADGLEVAIKAMHGQGLDATAKARFLREARVRIDAPQVVRVLETRSEGDALYIVMELVRGRSLADAVKQGPLPIPQALHVGEQLALGLAAAHRQGLVHRDVKPANVLLGQDGSVKLSDFGIAKAKDDESGLTATGQGIGTLDYVAPEQAEDAKRVSPAADLYALGATLYHALTGQPPFDSKHPGFFEHLLEDDPRPLRRLRPDCPPPVAQLVHRLLDKEPEGRPPSAAHVAEQLRRLRASP